MPIKKTHDEFLSDLLLANPRITAVGVYQKSTSPLEVRCNTCGYHWSPTPHNLLVAKSGCPKCSGKLQKTHAEFLKDIEGLPIKVLGEYSTSKRPIKVACLVCHHIWSPTPNNLLRGSGCPCCNKSGFKLNELATFYVYELGVLTGFGITNDLWGRDRTHRRTFKMHETDGRLVATFVGMGHAVKALEGDVKSKFKVINSGMDGFKRECVARKDQDALIACVVSRGLIGSIR